jgi:YesN/AraC family two-component response regulator
MLRLEYKIPDTITLTNFETIDELIFMIDDIAKSLCSHIKRYENSNDEDVIKRILEYIEENYTDYNFSINSMAQEFNMTVSNLSHCFKKHVNKTISDYITYLRMEKVKILLLTTDRNRIL